MGRSEIFGGVLLALLALGGTAMMQEGPELFPGHEELIFWLGFGAVIVAVLGLAILFMRSGKDRKQASRRPSTTFKLRGGSYDLADIDSKADTLVDAEKVERVELRRARHRPQPGADQGGDGGLRRDKRRDGNPSEG